MFIRFGGLVLLLCCAACAPELGAAPRLVATWPSPGANLSVARHTLDLTFNRPLQAEATSAAVTRQEDGAAVASRVTVDSASDRRLKVRLMEPHEGRYRLRWHAVAAQSTLASDGEYAFALRAEAPAPPRIEVSPATAEAKDTLELIGKGFARQSTVQLTMGDDSQTLASADTDAKGRFNVEAHVPEAVPLGTQPIVATDARGQTASTALQIHWGGWPPMAASLVGTPGPGAGEVSFKLNVRNRSDYVLEHVRVVLQDPEGGRLASAAPDAQRETNTVVWEIPVMDRGASGPFEATYRVDAQVEGHAWLQFRHRHSSGCTQDHCMPAFISEATSNTAIVSPAN